MRKAYVLSVKSFALALIGAGVFTLGQGIARADELRIVGTTTGTFGSSATLNELTYNPALIDGRTTNSLLLLTADPGVPNINNIGSFTLVANPGDFSEGIFKLTVQFQAPGGIIVGNPHLINGSAFLFQSDGSFGLLVDMDNTPQLFTFSDDSGTGLFSLTVDDLFLVFGSSQVDFHTAAIPNGVNIVNCTSFPCTGALTGTVRAEAIPEPATLLLLGTGMAGLASALRRRR